MTTVRIWFAKTGEASYISLLDLQRVMQRALKRSKLPVWYTMGFNPHIYMTFAAPLSLGQQSLVESVDVKTEEDDFDWSVTAERLNPCLPQGIYVEKVTKVITQAEDIAFAQYDIKYTKSNAEKAKNAFETYKNTDEVIVEKKTKKKGKVKQLNLKEHVEILNESIDENGYIITVLLPAGSKLNINPMLLLTGVENIAQLPSICGDIFRTALFTKEKQPFK